MSNSTPRYKVRYESKTTRCMWCWESINGVDSHTVVESTSPPTTEVHLHHKCFSAYLHLSGLEMTHRGGLQFWSPERIERLRLHLGISIEDFARRLGISNERFVRIMNGVPSAISNSIVKRIKIWAHSIQFDIKKSIDWSKCESLFSLRMHIGLKNKDMANQLDINTMTIVQWENYGVGKLAIRAWARLDALAKKHSFDSSMILEDYLWTNESFHEIFKDSKKSQRQWSFTSGIPLPTINNWLRIDHWNTKRRWNISRESAWKLTKAAISMGLCLPKKGRRRRSVDRREYIKKYNRKNNEKKKELIEPQN